MWVCKGDSGNFLSVLFVVGCIVDCRFFDVFMVIFCMGLGLVDM